MSIFTQIFTDECGNHIHPFTGLSSRESENDIKEKIRTLHESGLRSMVLLWEDPERTGDVSLFNSESYWQHMDWVVRYCREYGMTFLVQDAAPFPSGRADGWFDRPEYVSLRKLYLAQRHLDVRGPLKKGRFRADLLTGTMATNGLFQGNGSVPLAGNRLRAALAVKMEDGRIQGAPVDVTDCIEDGILFWDVPEGLWRIISVYETYNGGGRPGFMNLLDRDSVALQIKAVYEPHYAHLKNEIGKTWTGMFYDEPEVGNLEAFFFTQRVGTPKDLGNTPMDLPWSREAEERWTSEQGNTWRGKLAYLWYEGVGKEHEPVRYNYMELVSRLIRDNYNAQVYAWCRERGLLYIGHVLEDENSHCRLACGAVHFFRTEACQDMGGIDMIANQMIPGKDYTQAWYGSPEGDGEFYHYGLAKLASSAGHICPGKKGRSVCEIFAVYGARAGTRLRKSVMDHLFVNGITELIPCDPVFEHLEAEYSRQQNEYANRMCHLLTHTKAKIKTAILYHGENEWYAGECMKFQVPAAEMAKHQISYDIIPADVFSQQEYYHTECHHGLEINGNRYDALILPASKAVPRCVKEFLLCAEDFPVFYIGESPRVEAETGKAVPVLPGKCVKLKKLAAELKKVISPDLELAEEKPDLRYAHYVAGEGDRTTDVYLLYNQGGDTEVRVKVPIPGAALQLDLTDLTAWWLRKEEGAFIVPLREQESAVLCLGYLCTEEGMKEAGVTPRKSPTRSVLVEGPWQIYLEDMKKNLTLADLQDLGDKGLYPRYVGRIVYEKHLKPEELPCGIDLGDVHENAKVYVNGVCAGLRIAPPYRFCTQGLFTPGENTLRIEVYPNQGARQLPENPIDKVVESVSAAAYCAMEPAGMLGPVTLLYE
ncbi:hypothetical protein B5F07_09140 [Lachnoclostridium sp. An169]|uniref:hypothetical protein n=1 Tax=Lachnoclostridium sp. An169 TaxID=1965569 RepID=UPI000B377B5C|nr:hypothetical protein [Lachnoclostridium sp. An169]OUP84004.1 hypothetical protein B5F07_09140 [Lachnoclostridium sp. An169]